MIVPQFWAEARVRKIGARAFAKKGRAGWVITVKRFGWSDESLAAAQAHAEQRAQDALARILDGEKLPRIERRLPYNGSEGVPIREEVLARHGEAVITRNSYGARCLNVPDALFMDIDFEWQPRCGRAGQGGSHVGLLAALVLVATIAALVFISFKAGLAVLLFGGLGLFARILMKRPAPQPAMEKSTTPAKPAGEEPSEAEQKARERIAEFLRMNPDWLLRLYRTPAGLRLLAMQRAFSAQESLVAEAFKKLGIDDNYARMCHNQNCFRARVSAKPWRAGMDERIRPGAGGQAWPIDDVKMPRRQDWVSRYEAKAVGFAACRYVETLGGGQPDARIEAIARLHDELCRAQTQLPIA